MSWYTSIDDGIKHCTMLGLLELIQALDNAQSLYFSADEEDRIISSFTDSRDAHGKESTDRGEETAGGGTGWVAVADQTR